MWEDKNSSLNSPVTVGGRTQPFGSTSYGSLPPLRPSALLPTNRAQLLGQNNDIHRCDHLAERSASPRSLRLGNTIGNEDKDDIVEDNCASLVYDRKHASTFTPGWGENAKAVVVLEADECYEYWWGSCCREGR